MASLSTQRTSSSFPSSSSSSSCASSSSSSSSSSSIPQWTYEVFLSFRGKDTRKNFTDHLYASLKRNGIYTFRDDLKLKKGKGIRPELLKAIEESRFSIIILSKTYASSTWCLDELDKIIECKNELGQQIVPVFYDVDPSEVRNQTGNFQDVFAKHEEDFRDNQEKVQRWRAAMKEVGNLSGFHLKDRHESEFIQDIVKEISSQLSPTFSSTIEELVGMDLRLEKLSLHIDLSLNDVRLIGLCGMGGIGKTTLAKIVYSQLSRHFEGSSFLADVREVSQEGRLVSLQEQLLSQILMESSVRIWNVHDGTDMIRSKLCHKKVLVIIDDVDHIDQLKKLAGNHDWFGLGSRIFITTRDEHLLKTHGVDVVYKVEHLNHDEALQHFSLKAFKNNHLPTGYLDLSRRVVEYADGLPLFLEVFGSFLFGRSVDEWECALKRLKEDPGTEILDRLQISFDGLKETEKNIFLDVAFFFKGKDKDYVTKILDSCGFYPNIGLKVLIEKCFITISYNNKLSMHDLLQEMAKKIVKEESPKELGKRSRLWNKNEVHHVLMENMGSEAVVGVIHKFSVKENVYLSSKAFSKVNRLRLLEISNVQLSQGLDHLPNELRFLKWDRYPLKSLPSSFQPDKIVAVNLCYSRMQQLWKEIKPLNRLKFINLSHSQKLIMMPDFTWVPNLESLILEGCIKLSEVHPSIGFLKKLILLNLKDCKNLSSLPNLVKLESLEVCILAGCSKLKKFPAIIGKMESLKKLDVSGTAIGQFPSSILLLMKNLEELSFRGCKGPACKLWHLVSPLQLMQRSLDPPPLMLPSLSSLCYLTSLNLSHCNLQEGEIPNDLGHLTSLRILRLNNNNFVSLPTSISQLLNLSHLYLRSCNRLKLLPELSSNMRRINIRNCTSLEIQSDAVRVARTFFGVNCFKLAANEGGDNVAFAMMKKCFQEQLLHCFNLVLPGSEIPKWYSYRSERNSIRIKRLARFHKLIGLAVCCVFVVHVHPPTYSCSSIGYHLKHVMNVHRGNVRPSHRISKFSIYEGLGPITDHVSQFFISKRECMKKCEKGHKRIRIWFEAVAGSGLEVKKCGIHPVYEHNLEEFKQTMNQCNSSIFENFNDLNQDLDKSALDGAQIKQICDGCDGSETNGSGSNKKLKKLKQLVVKFLQDPRLYALLNKYLKKELYLFFFICFVLGSIWVFGYPSSLQATKLFRLCILFLSLGYINFVFHDHQSSDSTRCLQRLESI